MKNRIFLLFMIVTLNLNAQKVYNFSLPNIENEMKTFDEVKGEKLTIIDFWATWCKPCQASIPKINNLYDEFKDQGLEVIGISIDSPRNQAKIAPLVNALGIHYPVLLDKNQEVMSDFNVSSVPVLYIINSKSEIVYMHEGYSMGDEVELKNKIIEFLKSAN